jgi:hypothetical protein
MRLIDAEALLKTIREQPWKHDTKVSLVVDWICNIIHESPTLERIGDDMSLLEQIKHVIDKGFMLENSSAKWLLEKIEAQQNDINDLKVMLNDIKVHNMAMENGEIDMTIEGPNARNLFASIVQAFRQNGGENFYSVDLQDRETGESFTVTIQNNGKDLSPTQKLNIQEEQIKSLTVERDELIKVLKQAREAIKAAWSDGSVNAAMNKASEALAAIDKAIGGKEDE